MHFEVARRYFAVLVVGSILLVGTAASLSLPRGYLLMATTTSARDTGFLTFILPRFTAETGVEVRYVAVGTGQAIEAGRRGDADVVMVHAPSKEADFMASGDGLCRNPLMYNRSLESTRTAPSSNPARTTPGRTRRSSSCGPPRASTGRPSGHGTRGRTREWGRP